MNTAASSPLLPLSSPSGAAAAAGRPLLPPAAATARPQLRRSSTAPAPHLPRSCRDGVVLRARRKSTASEPPAGSDSPEPAAAGRKGRRKKTDAAAEPAAAAAAAPPPAAASLEALAVSDDDIGEEDRRRFPYHRRLQTAAAEGNVASAELVFSGMAAAGLEPGPRAYHTLLCAHLKAGNTQGALEVAGRATTAGVPLLPESYAVLIFAALSATPPDADVAKSIFAALAGTDTDAQLPWATLCRLLSAKGFAADAVAAVKAGLRSGRALDYDVAEAYIKSLCDLGQSDAALAFLESMGPRYGMKPQARHVTYVVAADAASGAFGDASALIDSAGNKGWGRNAAAFNALLAGLVRALQEGQGREGEATPEQAQQQEELTNSFARMTGRMVQCGVRPNRVTFKLEAEGHICLGDARSAMGSIKSLRTAAGTGGMRLLDGGALAALLQLLAAQDMPVDMLQLLVFMSEDGCRMPPGALAPDAEGRTALDAWLLGHMDLLAARAEQAEAASALLSAPIEYVDSIPLGPGRCVVDESGRVVPVAKCSVRELRAEASARGVADAAAMKKPELVAAVQAARARLPFNVLTAQVKGAQITTATKKKSSRAPTTAAPKAKKRSSKQPNREVWSVNVLSGEVEVLPAPPDSAFRTEAEKFLLAESALADIDLTDDQYSLASNKSIKDIDFDALLEARMLDEGTAAVMNVGDEDVVSGFATLLPAGADEEDDDAADDEEGGAAREGELDEAAWAKMQSFEARSIDPQTLQEGYRQLQFLEAQQIDTDEANLVAGMDVAMDIVRAAEIVGGAVTGPDLLTLAAGALAERNANAGADVARRLAALLQQYDPQTVLQQYEALADMCLQQRALQQADVVLEAAEAAGLQPSREVLARLTAALRGQPRRGERLGRENAALLQRAGVDELEELTSPPDLQLSQEQQQQLPDAAAAAATAAVQAAEVAVDALAAADDEGEELPQDVQELLSVVAGAQQWRERQDQLAAALRPTGLSEDRISDILMQPAALLADLSWAPGLFLADDDEGGEDDAAAAAAAGDGDAAAGGSSSSSSGGGSINEMSFMQLAKAAARGTLTPEQTNELLDVADEAGLPMLFDEAAQQILWPGTPQYEEWAAEVPEEAEQDGKMLSAAFDEVFGEDMAEAEQLGATMAAAVAGGQAPSLGFDNPQVKQWLSLKEQYQETLAELGLELDPEQQQAEADAPDAAAGDAADQELTREEKAAMLQQLHEQLSAMVDGRRDDLAAAFERMGLPVPDLSLGADDDSSSSSRQKQLTGS